MNRVSVNSDIAIIGGGPVGAALALALQHSGLRITVLEARVERTSAPRPIALSHGSRLLLERLNAWRGLTGTPINHIHVSQRGGFGRVALSAADAGVPSLGYVIDYNDLFCVLSDAARAAHDDYRDGARATRLQREGDHQRIDYTHDGASASLNARWVVVADGGDLDGLAPPHTKDYAQHALTACVRTSRPHQNVAYERFTPDGPLALLPFGDEFSLVWTLTPERAAQLRDADDKTFLVALRDTFGARVGEFKSVSQRACYPLTLRYTVADNAPGVVTIGNAAQTLHPVAGQGFNLGLRDAWTLAQTLRDSSPQALTYNANHANHDYHDALHRFRARRRLDRDAMVAATHGLVQLFSNGFLPLQVARGMGMTLLDAISPVRNFLARRMIFGARGL